MSEIHWGYAITDTYDRLYGKDETYLYVMTVYHLLIPIWMVAFGFNEPMTFAIINPTNLANSESVMTDLTLANGLTTITWAFLIVLLDLFFLFALKWHFHHARITLSKKRRHVVDLLSWQNISRSELAIFVLSFYSVALREIMLFLSINTIQIAIAYVIIRKIPFNLGRVLMCSAAYLFIVKLLIWPLFN